jgi:hypothetical protein
MSDCKGTQWIAHKLTSRSCILLGVPLFITTIAAVTSAQSESPEQRAAIAADLAKLDTHIAAADTENAKYAGGLVKALVESRIATLKQTRAMLDQRAKAWAHGIALNYTVDGQPFAPPSSAKEQLATVEQEVVAARAKVAAAERDAGRYAGGLVHALSLTTLETTRQTEAMLDQRRLALKYELPQYIGFAKESTKPGVAASPVAPTPPAERDWDIVAIDSRVTESNNTWSKFAWKLTLRSKSSAPLRLDATIEFNDKDGFIVDTDRGRNLMLPAGEEKTFTGFALIRAAVAGNVARLGAKVHVVSR